MAKHNKYTFVETPDLLSGASEDMYTEDSLPRDWVNCGAQELLLNAFGDKWHETRLKSEIQQCIRTTECMLMSIAAHEKEKGRKKPKIWMPGTEA